MTHLKKALLNKRYITNLTRLQNGTYMNYTQQNKKNYTTRRNLNEFVRAATSSTTTTTPQWRRTNERYCASQQNNKNNKRFASFLSKIPNNVNHTTTLQNIKRTNIQNQQKRQSSSFTTNLSPAVMRKVQSMSSRHAQILSLLQSSDTPTTDTTSLGKELSSLARVASLCEKLSSIKEEFTALEELLQEACDGGDGELEKECLEEMKGLEEQKRRVEVNLVESVLPKDEDDFGCDAILEIRAGTGGDEAALFAGELLTSYEKECKARNWKFEVLSQTKTDLGGIKEAAVSLSGGSSGGGSSAYSSYDLDLDSNEEEEGNDGGLNQLGPYGYFKFESGVHRVQRVPVNDVRIHTSAVSVAVLPATNDNSNDNTTLLPTNELKIEVFRASGAGGQHVNTTESAVRITHIPTGVTAAIQDERSQHKNKAKAMKLVSARVLDKKRELEAKERGDAKNNLMGGGDRSERIRTYNYPQDRVTDHRCKHSEHGIVKLFDGGSMNDGGGGGSVVSGLVGTFAPFMRSMYRDEMLQKIEEEEEEEEEEQGKESNAANKKGKGNKKGKK